MERRILKLTAISAFAIAMGVACNKKDAVDAALDQGAHLENCPEMQEGSYVLDDAAPGHAKVITIKKVADPDPKIKDKRYNVDFDGIENVTFVDNTNPQPQGPDGKLGAIRTGCPVKGTAAFSGKTMDPDASKGLRDIALRMTLGLGGPDGKTQVLHFDNGTRFTKSNAVAATAHSVATTGITTGIPDKSDLAANQPSAADKAKQDADKAAQDAKNKAQQQLDKAQQEIDKQKK